MEISRHSAAGSVFGPQPVDRCLWPRPLPPSDHVVVSGGWIGPGLVLGALIWMLLLSHLLGR